MSFFDGLFHPQRDRDDDSDDFDFGPVSPPPAGSTGSSGTGTPADSAPASSGSGSSSGPADPADPGTPDPANPPVDGGTPDPSAPADPPVDGTPDPAAPEAPPAAPEGNDDDDDTSGGTDGNPDDDEGEGDDPEPPAESAPDYADLFGFSRQLYCQRTILILDKKGKVETAKGAGAYFQSIAAAEAKSFAESGIKFSDNDLRRAVDAKINLLQAIGRIRFTIAIVDSEGKYVGELEGAELNTMAGAFARFEQASSSADPLERDLKAALSELSPEDLQGLGLMMNVKPAHKGQKLRPADFLRAIKDEKKRKLLLRIVKQTLTAPNDPDDDDDNADASAT